MEDKILKTHVAEINGENNGGESVWVETSFRDTKYGIVQNQKIVLNSYCNRAEIFLTDVMKPDFLRQLANDLETIQHQLCHQRNLDKAKK